MSGRSSTAPAAALDPGVWEHASTLIDGAFAVPLDDAAAAIRTIAERMRVIAEGAGALATAAAIAGKAGLGQRGLHRLRREHRSAGIRQDPCRRDALIRLTTLALAAARWASDTDGVSGDAGQVSS